jgi:hypothetical protein
MIASKASTGALDKESTALFSLPICTLFCNHTLVVSPTVYVACLQSILYEFEALLIGSYDQSGPSKVMLSFF